FWIQRSLRNIPTIESQFPKSRDVDSTRGVCFSILRRYTVHRQCAYHRSYEHSRKEHEESFRFHIAQNTFTVVLVAQWTVVVGDRSNHTILRERKCREDPCNRCTRMCAASRKSSDPAM